MIKVKVKTNSGKQIVEKKEDYYLVHLKSPAREGKANLELEKVLKKHFGKEVKIKRGLKSRNKIVEVDL